MPKSFSWWQLGEAKGYEGRELALYRISCAFCLEKGNFSTVHHQEKKKPNSAKKLNFDTLRCGNCGGFVMVLWSGGNGLHDFAVLPWPTQVQDAPQHWPETIGRFWLQAHRNLRDENWDAAAVMARSALQVALREQGAEGRTLKDEVDDLADKGVLPPIMKEWSGEVRELGNDSAHPSVGQSAATESDVHAVVGFLDFLLEYLYDLPFRIAQHRARRNAERDG